MDGDGAVEIGLASPHLYGDGKALDDLVGPLTDDVDTHNSLFGALDDELEGGGLLVMFVDHTEVEGLEGSFIDLDSISILLSGLWLSQTNGSHGRVSEDNGGDVFVAELVILEFRRTKETIGKPSSSSDGDRGQEPLAGHVSDGRDTRNVGVLVLVDDNVALGGGLDAESFQTEVFSIGLAANCPQENIGLDLVALVGVDGQVSWFTLDLCDHCLTMKFDAGVLHPRSEDFLYSRVESSEDGITTNEEVGFGSEGIEYAREFDGDVTSADDDNSFRLVFKGEETIRTDTEARSGNFFVRGGGRVTTDRDTNVVCLDGVGILARLRNLDLGGGQDGSVTVEEVDVLSVPIGLVNTTEFLDISVALRLESGPVKLWLVKTLELVSCGMTKLVSEIGGMPHQLFGNTSDVDASASVVRGGFDYRDFLSVRGGTTCSSRTTTTTSNKDDVILVGELDRGHLGRVKRSGDLGESLERGQLMLLAREEMESQRWGVFVEYLSDCEELSWHGLILVIHRKGGLIMA